LRGGERMPLRFHAARSFLGTTERLFSEADNEETQPSAGRLSRVFDFSKQKSGYVLID